MQGEIIDISACNTGQGCLLFYILLHGCIQGKMIFDKFSPEIIYFSQFREETLEKNLVKLFFFNLGNAFSKIKNNNT